MTLMKEQLRIGLEPKPGENAKTTARRLALKHEQNRLAERQNELAAHNCTTSLHTRSSCGSRWSPGSREGQGGGLREKLDRSGQVGKRLQRMKEPFVCRNHARVEA